MRIGVLGTGMVGRALATRLVGLGHEVRMGSRAAGNERGEAWAAEAGEPASAGSFAEAAAFGEIVINATAGAGSVDAVTAAAAGGGLDGTVLVDVANPMERPPGGGPMRLSVCNDDSLAEQLQRAAPAARVVKTLNTMTADVMVDPALVAGDHVVFVCGDDDDAKAATVRMLGEFGWPEARILDLGGLTAARATEMYLPLWVALRQRRSHNRFNITVADGDAPSG